MTNMQKKNNFGARREMNTPLGKAVYYRLATLEEDGVGNVSRLPFSIKVLLESVLRGEDGYQITAEDVQKLATYDPKSPAAMDFPFKPARVLMQDFTGVPAIVDLAAMRSAMKQLGGDPARINPLIPVDLVIDHSLQVDKYASADALQHNMKREFERNRERYEFLHWGQKAFDGLSVVPPASGICHQVNLENLGRVIRLDTKDGEPVAYPDSLVGTDSHTPMINGLGIVGWGVGGIEAEAIMLGQPLYMLLPPVVGVRLTGKLPRTATATDVALTVTQMLRAKGVVGKFVEFYGPGITSMTLTDRATVSNMAPEYGATISYFPIDTETLRFMEFSGRGGPHAEFIRQYAIEQGLFRTDEMPDPIFAETVELDLSAIEPSLAGPKRPQDRIEMKNMKQSWQAAQKAPVDQLGFGLEDADLTRQAEVEWPDGTKDALRHGDVVIAALTSCTNTSNPSVMLGAGLVAKKAVEKGLTVKPYVKTSLAPGSMVVTRYLKEAGLMEPLETLGFHNVGYGCTTCIGNSGPLDEPVAKAIRTGNLIVSSVVSGNRNFEGRIHPQTKANYLTSPLFVVAYALAGTVAIDLETEAIGKGTDGEDVFLKDIWPTPLEIRIAAEEALDTEMFAEVYETLLTQNETWNAIPATGEAIYNWSEESTYIQQPPFFVDMKPEAGTIGPITNAHVLVKVADSITTDHISPAGAFAKETPAGQYLLGLSVDEKDFNSYGSRRGNDRVMVRGTFANLRLRNQLAPGTEGGWTTHTPSGEVISIHEASLRYKKDKTPLVVLAGKDYGMGSSRDWAAKGTYLLGVRAVLARSFERIHRSNLVGMGVLPLQFNEGDSVESLGLTGKETFTISLDDDLKPAQDISVDITMEDGSLKKINMLCRIDTAVEVDYYRNGGILHTVLRGFLQEA